MVNVKLLIVYELQFLQLYCDVKNVGLISKHSENS